MGNWIWQDWVAVASLIFGVAGLILTIFTLAKAGSIKKAVDQAKTSQINKIKYINKREQFLKTLKPLRKKLIGDVKGTRSSGEIKEIFSSVEELVLSLSECCEHFSNEHKGIIKSCKEFIVLSFNNNHILNGDDCSKMRDYVVQIYNILNQEEYYL